MRVRITSGEFGGRFIKTLPSLRPTSDLVRKALFDILGARVIDADFLDLYAGSGAVGFEAVSRGAAHTTLVDDNPHHIKLMRANAAVLQLNDRVSIRQTTAHQFIESSTKPFDIIFADPWYSDHLDIGDWHHPHFLRSDGLIVIEHDVKNPPTYSNDLKILQQKVYGDTALTFYTRAA